MMNISKSALLPYSARQMYDVVADIRSYPDFLNWCAATEIISENSEEVVATVVVAYTKLNMEFTTRNLNTPHQSIKLDLVSGPFTSLQGEWSFLSLSDEACKVSLNMSFDLEQSLTKRIMAKVFTHIVTAQLDAFQARAKTLYGGV